MFKELLSGGDRALCWAIPTRRRSSTSAESRCAGPRSAGDSLLLDLRSGYVYERIPRPRSRNWCSKRCRISATRTSAVWVPRSKQIRDAVEVAPSTRTSTPSTSPPAKGDPAVRSARLRQDPHRQGGCGITGAQGDRAHRRRRGSQLLPQHQGPGVAEQVCRRNRAPHPTGVPAGP